MVVTRGHKTGTNLSVNWAAHHDKKYVQFENSLSGTGFRTVFLNLWVETPLQHKGPFHGSPLRTSIDIYVMVHNCNWILEEPLPLPFTLEWWHLAMKQCLVNNQWLLSEIHWLLFSWEFQALSLTSIIRHSWQTWNSYNDCVCLGNSSLRLQLDQIRDLGMQNRLTQRSFM